MATDPKQPRNVRDDLDLKSIFRSVWRRKLMIAVVSFLTACAGVYYAYRVAEPVFSSTAVVEFSRDQQQGLLDVGSLVGGTFSDFYSLNTEISKIESREMIEQIVQRLDLTSNEEFNPFLWEQPSFSLRDTIKGLIGWTEEPKQLTEEERAALELRLTTAVTRQNIDVSIVRETYLIYVTARSASPNMAARLANTLSEVYIEDQFQQKFAAASRAIDFLSDRARELEEELLSQENELRTLKGNSDLVDSESLELMSLQVKEFRNRIDTSRTTLAEQRVALLNLRDAQRSTDKAVVLNLAKDQLLTRLAAPLDAKLQGSDRDRFAFDQRLTQLIDRAGDQLTRAEAEIASLETALARQEERVQTQSADLLQLEQVERELGVTRDLYQSFLTGLQEATVQVGLVQADTSLMSKALAPRRPVSPNRNLIIALAGLGGMVLASLFVVLRDSQSATVRSSEELTKLLDLPVLGEVPIVPARKRKHLLTYFVENPTSLQAEAMRNLRTSVLMSNVDRPPQVIMLTSAVPGEGKTSLSITMAYSLAGLDKRVLLIEGDMRRRVFSEYFDISREFGLVDVLAGTCSLADVISPERKLGFDIIGGKKTGANPADLYASHSFEQLLKELRKHYDHIVIDTPPTLVVPDARIVRRNVDASILVVKWDSTHVTSVREAANQLLLNDGHITGCVLSQVNSSRMKKYGYGYGAYSGYGGRYYGAS